ncbi:NO-inducible flavohemoprotein [Aneurinibacillus thermoaerophilus]|uniref:Flavohemoprotein n=1 Tax=Aneurinibacillus thermoaerophilus TaxID=143495 RepID=A0ABX8YG51_ANETH|nr:NO-inducible flavohemoprotein [Aneurinibacillus thermoaerophilus]MED0681138.1 NO-inducible flavohemoprotein [Aneurinibacillus thermoaerophilus]MED0735650.1 NO-inducible flavohemoprotein [Aneurinibacillus thermoaerophilus]MED0766362.1 NO-inducible flavohemoprotein [Aneurinibacillus thermoaerophilus]QYY44019.1 NO-inducible flavohemoprotein [Aneurinibacillus thermoaerophilus]
MLSPKTIEIIKSTVPVLEDHGKAITTRFYESMLTNHPELLNIFNHANQKQGRQQTALANAVYAAAANIDNLEAILPAVIQIAHKHISLGVKPEHYPIVGKYLLIAIKDVLGNAATDEIIQAWKEAYQAIADVFISVEAEMYQQAERQEGGWAGFRKFIVVKKVKESDVITSFYLKPEDGQAIASFLPGQYISMKIGIPGEKYTHIRQYSLSDSPGKDYYRISVKREDESADKPAGIVSTYLHKHVQEGDVLQISVPAGDFVLDMEKELPIVLISGGVGLTPMISMLNTLAEVQPEREVTFIHAAINSTVHAMREHVTRLATERGNVRSFVCYEKPTEEDRAARNYDKEGYIDLEWLQTIVPSPRADFYFCGPIPFMKTIYGALKQWGVAEEAIHFEFFGPKGELSDRSVLK